MPNSPDEMARLIAQALRDTDGVAELHPNPRALLRGLTRRAFGGEEQVEVDVRLVKGRAVVHADVICDPEASAIEVAAAAQRNSAAVLAEEYADLEVDLCISARPN